MPPVRPHRRIAALIVAAVGASTALSVGLPLDASASTHKASAVNLSGVTLTFGDQLKEYQTIFAATNALKGAAYTVNWADFVGGPPVIAAETGGSVDLGDMAETPTIFAQAAGDPVKVVAATEGVNPKVSPYSLVVPAGSVITQLSQLRGKTIAVQEGTIEQYFLVLALKKANIPYSAVTVENLSLTDGSTAVTNGKVDAAVVVQPLAGIDQATGKVRTLLSGAGLLQTLGYLTASQSALDNPQKAAAISDFIARFYRASAILRADPSLAAQTYVKTYGVPLAVAKEAVASSEAAATPITNSIIGYQQAEANAFLRLGLLTKPLNVKGIFDLPFNRAVARADGLHAP